MDKLQPGQRAVVMGMGISGKAAVRFLLRQGVSVAVSDRRQLTDLPAGDQKYLQDNNIAFEGGQHSLDFVSQGDCIIISPGIPTDLPILVEMRAKRVPILGELALAAPYLTERVVAVTGTNGKTTVTSLIAELLTSSGKKVFVGGNIGTPLLDYLCSDEKADVLVLELSSFQLESAGTFCPHIAVLLNITPDHLDRHGNMERYIAAKMNMFKHQGKNDKAILHGDDSMYEQTRASLTRQEVYCFGNESSDCVVRGWGQGVMLNLRGREEQISLAGTMLNSHTGRINSEAAVLATSLLGCSNEDMEKGLKRFIPAAHRLQYVRRCQGVEFYNDSKATNTGAVHSALESFPGNIILIAGGRDKGEDYSVLQNIVQDKVKQLILLGEAAGAIASALDAVCDCCAAESMEEAVTLAASIAQTGDIVLLAPACASYDMFDNYGHRGDVFMQAVMALQDVQEEKVA